MNKIALLTIVMNLLMLSLHAQNLEVEGKVKVTVMDTVTDASANVVRQADGTLALRQFQIGDLAHGGIIFHVDESGEHGLVSDTVDLSTSTRWYAGSDGVTQAKGDGVFAGEMNTTIIISSQVAIGDDGNLYAARLCAELEKGGFSDWYLPSKEELNLMHTNLHLEGLGGFASMTEYWSSTEDQFNFAWFQIFTSGAQGVAGKSVGYRVRAIRAF